MIWALPSYPTPYGYLPYGHDVAGTMITGKPRLLTTTLAPRTPVCHLCFPRGWLCFPRGWLGFPRCSLGSPRCALCFPPCRLCSLARALCFPRRSLGCLASLLRLPRCSLCCPDGREDQAGRPRRSFFRALSRPGNGRISTGKARLLKYCANPCPPTGTPG